MGLHVILKVNNQFVNNHLVHWDVKIIHLIIAIGIFNKVNVYNWLMKVQQRIRLVHCLNIHKKDFVLHQLTKVKFVIGLIINVEVLTHMELVALLNYHCMDV